jgi:hypothetical protein
MNISRRFVVTRCLLLFYFKIYFKKKMISLKTILYQVGRSFLDSKKYFVSYRIVSYRIVSYRIVSYRIVSYILLLYCNVLYNLPIDDRKKGKGCDVKNSLQNANGVHNLK